MINKALFSSEKSDWETPKKLFDELHAQTNFVLDAAASKENAKCKNYIGLDLGMNSLDMSWSEHMKDLGLDGYIWLNPPYGKGIGEWVKKAYNEGKNNHVLCLLPARTDTKWFHEFIFDKWEKIADGHFMEIFVGVRFLKGRLKFVGGKSSAPFPSMLVHFGPNLQCHDQDIGFPE